MFLVLSGNSGEGRREHNGGVGKEGEGEEAEKRGWESIVLTYIQGCLKT